LLFYCKNDCTNMPQCCIIRTLSVSLIHVYDASYQKVCSNNGSLSCVTFWVVLRRMVFNNRRFGTLFHLHRRVDAKSVFRIHSPMKMEQTQCFETSAIKHHTPKNNQKGYTRHSEHGESLESRMAISLSVQIIYVLCEGHLPFVPRTPPGQLKYSIANMAQVK
jgi:hypothetical protein